LTAQFSHPFGAFRINDKQDSRPAAALLAARLARTPEEQRAARDAALALVGSDDGADYRIARALQQQLVAAKPSAAEVIAQQCGPRAISPR